jgi:hypothetical protein
MRTKPLLACCLSACLTVTPGTCAAQCVETAQTLEAERLDAAALWIGRVNQDRAHYLAVANQLLTDDATFSIERIGTFSPKVLAVEYGLALFPIIGTPPVKVHQTFDPYRTRWLEPDRLEIHALQHVSLDPDPVTGAYAISVGQLDHHELLDFEPCSTRINLSYVINDPSIEQLYETAQKVDPVTICTAILIACPVGSPLQQYADVQECVDFLHSLAPSVCPFPFTSDTVLCRALHVSQALIDPTVHCPHVGRSSPVCFEHCLPACAACSTDAHCDARFVDLTSAEFSCECNDGFSGSGAACERDACDAPRDCPADPRRAACTDGLCGCVPDVHWDPSTTARERRDACGCAADELLAKRPEDPGVRGRRRHVPACVPTGRCFEVHDCPQSPKVVQCLPTPENAYDTSNVCECNYGFGGGWESDCVCPPGRREVRLKAKHGARVCLAANECTRDRDCARGVRCARPADAVVGMCEGSAPLVGGG